MAGNAKSPGARDLAAAIAALKTPDEATRFLRDLTTPAEMRAFEERWAIAQMLDEGRPYRDIAEALGGSTTTVARVARFLKDEPHQGYRLLLDRLAAPSRGKN